MSGPKLEFMQSPNGHVHLMQGCQGVGEYTVCGQAYDDEEAGVLEETDSTAVSYPECISTLEWFKAVLLKRPWAVKRS